MAPMAFLMTLRAMAKPSFLGIQEGMADLSAGLPFMYFGRTQTPRRAETHRFLAIGRWESSEAISIAELPMPTTTTFLPRMSTGSNGSE